MNKEQQIENVKDSYESRQRELRRKMKERLKAYRSAVEKDRINSIREDLHNLWKAIPEKIQRV